jgi:hypothetical protein
MTLLYFREPAPLTFGWVITPAAKLKLNQKTKTNPIRLEKPWTDRKVTLGLEFGFSKALSTASF